MMTPAELVERAESAGARVEWTISVARADYGHGVIRVNPRLPESAQVVALAHELGHHHYGHTGNSERQEREANAYAARLLVTDDEYRQAERLVGHEPGAIARELGVTVPLVVAWRSCKAA